MVIRTAQFVITGASFTEKSRDLMREGDWKKALAVLTDGLQGISYEQAIAILEGKSRLEGTNDAITMVDEAPEVTDALQNEYFSVFGMGGFVKRNNRMYQAYLVIDNLGPEDAEKVYRTGDYTTNSVIGTGWFDEIDSVHMKACRPVIYGPPAIELRGMFYARRPDTDFASMVRNKGGKWVVVLFEETTEGITPFWREKENTDTQAAYNQVAEYLPIHGYCQRQGFSLEQVLSARSAQAKHAPLQPSAEERAQAAEARAAEEKAAQENARQFKVQCESLRESISEFANSDTEYGWHTFIWKDKEKIGPHEVLRAPKRALICYALSTTYSRHLMPAYTAFSPEGLKLARDNPYHTDVWLGCGFNIDDKAYDRNNPKYHAVVDMMFEMQKKLLNFEAQVLARGPEVTGTVVYHDSPDITADSVLVVPHAGEEFHVQAMRAGAVICEVGGRLAHLVTVCRELDKPIIRMEGALRKFKLGQTVTVIPAQGKVEVHMRRVSATGDFV